MQEIDVKSTRVGYFKQILPMLLLISSIFVIGTVNLSEIWLLMQEIVDNTSVIIGLVIMGVTISIALYIGDFVKGLLKKATGK